MPISVWFGVKFSPGKYLSIWFFLSNFWLFAFEMDLHVNGSILGIFYLIGIKKYIKKRENYFKWKINLF